MSKLDMPQLSLPRRQRPVARRARGMALVFVLIMMSIIFIIAAVSSRLVTEGERTARNDRDRQTALQAAEVALSDAEVDIMGPAIPTGLGTRVAMFGTLPADEGCSTEATTRGYCGRLLPTSSTASLLDIYRPIFEVSDTSSSRAYATFGEFTGRDDEFAVSSGGALPSRLPRYVIEKSPINFRNRAQTVGKPLDAYIVTAIGYGLNPETQVILRAVISKPVATN